MYKLTNQHRYSPVGNISMLEILFERGLIKDYVLLLAQDVDRHISRYKTLIKDIYRKYDEATIILDNGAAEGTTMGWDQLSNMGEIIEASYIVMPDALNDARATVGAAESILSEGPYKGTCALMAVAQGHTVAHINWCVQKIIDLDVYGDVVSFAVPRCQVSTIGTRIPGCLSVGCTPEGRTTPVHLLGMSNDMHHDIQCVREMRVMGIDSANPIVLGLHGINLKYAYWEHMPRPYDYLTREYTDKDIPVEVNHNIELMFYQTALLHYA